MEIEQFFTPIAGVLNLEIIQSGAGIDNERLKKGVHNAVIIQESSVFFF